MTEQEVLELDAFCRERFVELVPNQNSFGHLRYWLEHPPLKGGVGLEWGQQLGRGGAEGGYGSGL